MCRKLTLRIEDEATDKVLTKVMALMNEKTANKTIMRLITDYESTQKTLRNKENRIEKLEHEISDFKYKLNDYLDSRSALENLVKKKK